MCVQSGVDSGDPDQLVPQADSKGSRRAELRVGRQEPVLM